MSPGPWEDFAQPAADGPWNNYQPQQPEAQPQTDQDLPASFLDRFNAGAAAQKIEQQAANKHPSGIDLLSSPDGRSKLWEAVKSYPQHFLEGTLETLETPGDVYSGKVDLGTDEGMNRAMGLGTLIGLGRLNKLPLTAETAGVALRSGEGIARIGEGPDGTPVRQPVGNLPRPEDFSTAAKVLDPTGKPASSNLRLVEAPEGGVYEPEQVKKNEKYFKAVDADGKTAAEMLVRFDGKTANIEDILAPGKPREEGRGAIGTGDMRSLLRQFQEAHPEVETITGKRVSGANMGGGYSLLNEPTQVEVNLRRMWTEDGIHPAEAVHDAQSDAFLKNEITAARETVKLDPEDELVLSETGGKPGDLSAARTDPADISPDVQPASPPGRLAAAFKDAGDKLLDIGRDAQMLIAPMATGTRDSMAIAKDFANSMRRNRWDWSRIDKDIADKFTPEQRARMWNAADEESLSLRLDEPASMREHQGMATLEPAERAMVEQLQTRSQNAWVRARDIGMVEGEGLPAYTPRMIINVASAGSKDTALALDGIGGNLRTKTGNLLKRKYMEAQDTEAAAKAKYGDQAMLARDIRVLPLATSQLEDAIAGRTLINNIKEYGERTGTDTVSEGAIPSGSETKWFTLDHPSFKTWRPKFQDGAAVKDEAGNTIFEQVPLYVHGDFEGPLRAVLSQKSGATYGAMMALKGKTMSLIMNSPMIHNAVEWGRAFPAAPFKVGTFKVYFEGNAAKKNVPLMHEAIDNGLVPIGHRFFNQDITSVMESPDLTPGRSLTAKVAGFVPGLFDPAAETAVRTAIDKAGDFWHNTLLWDRIGDLQMGLYKNFLDAGIEKGLDRATSAKVAAHMANRYAGSLPKEAMSDGATKLANIMLFSRSFTLGNLGVMKDMLTGLPKDVMAQIERDAGFKAGSIDMAGEEGSIPQSAASLAKSMARRKAMATVALDVGLLYVGNSVMQSALNVMLGSNTLDQEAHGYIRRFRDYMEKGSQNPLSMLWPSNVTSLSSTSENEPGLENRLKIGHTKDGTAIYARNPVGKIGEEFTGWGTGPLDMLRKKQGTIARPLLQILSNDGGFGRKIYDPDADTPAKYAGTVWAIAKHLAGSQLPEGQISALSDLVKGEGDKTVNELQLAGPLAGVTFRKGAPGGEAVGEMYHNKSAFEFRVQQAMPDIRKQILRGDQAGAEAKMTDIGMDASYSRWVLKTTLNPATRLGSKALRDFYRTATPEQRDRMTRIQGGPQTP
jgi:hypothetical protein